MGLPKGSALAALGLLAIRPGGEKKFFSNREAEIGGSPPPEGKSAPPEGKSAPPEGKSAPPEGKSLLPKGSLSSRRKSLLPKEVSPREGELVLKGNSS
jgi:hypothetical protein